MFRIWCGWIKWAWRELFWVDMCTVLTTNWPQTVVSENVADNSFTFILFTHSLNYRKSNQVQYSICVIEQKLLWRDCEKQENVSWFLLKLGRLVFFLPWKKHAFCVQQTRQILMKEISLAAMPRRQEFRRLRTSSQSSVEIQVTWVLNF